MFYRLDPETKEAIKVENLQDLAFDVEHRRVGLYENGSIMLSTVFLGIDHSYLSSEPILFETMLFVGNASVIQHRYTTYKKAEQGHSFILSSYVKKEFIPNIIKKGSYRRFKRWLQKSAMTSPSRELRRIFPQTRHSILKGAY